MKDLEKMTPEEIADMVRRCNEWITGSGIVRIIDSSGKLAVATLVESQMPPEGVEVKKVLTSE